MLALIETFNNELSKTNFQKLLLILAEHQKKPSFDFVPYKYGCFSFQSYADIRTMIKYKLIEEVNSERSGDKWIKITDESFREQLRKDDLNVLNLLFKKFKDATTNEIIRYTYKNYPYYAINSTIARNILESSELEIIDRNRPKNDISALYTIGYEGISLEKYINKLIVRDIKVLCDVRKNALSMKYGFSKNQLKNACDAVGIKYIQFSELGVESSKRKELINQEDYDDLFSDYCTNTLTTENAKSAMDKIYVLLMKFERVALTCFEADINQCHRKHLASQIQLKNQLIKIIHI